LFAETEAVDTGWPRFTAAPGGGEEEEKKQRQLLLISFSAVERGGSRIETVDTRKRLQ
jgi:hypothetical protein